MRRAVLDPSDSQRFDNRRRIIPLCRRQPTSPPEHAHPNLPPECQVSLPFSNVSSGKRMGPIILCQVRMLCPATRWRETSPGQSVFRTPKLRSEQGGIPAIHRLYYPVRFRCRRRQRNFESPPFPKRNGPASAAENRVAGFVPPNPSGMAAQVSA